MMYKTHAALGLLAGLLAASYVDINKYAFLAAVIFGSLFVDIDEDNSYIGRKAGFLSSVIEFLFGHRGIFHSLLAALGIFLGVYYFGHFELGLGFLIGYASHLAADMLTVNGVKPFYPFSRYTVRGFIRTDGLLEKLFFILILLAIGYIIYIKI